MNRRIWLLLALVALTIIGASSVAAGSLPGSALGQTKGEAVEIDLQNAQANDGFDALPLGLKSVSMSTLVNMGLVTPQDLPDLPKPVADERFTAADPNTTITWGAEANASGAISANEPGAAVHPSNPLFAIVSGNTPIDNTSNGGLTWQSRQPANPSPFGDVVPVWIPLSPNQDHAMNASLNSAHGASITSGRSTDRGVTWQNFPTNIDTPGFFNDREYLWVDHDPASPFYGRLYLTGTFFDTGGSGSFNATFNRYSSDNGATWSAPFTFDSGPIGAIEGNAQFASIGVGPGGVVYHGYMEARCCGNPPSFGDFNKYHVAKSTDGGVTFPISVTAASDTAARSVSFNSNGPAGFRWSPQATLAADPTDNYVYMIWLAKRVNNSNVGVATHMTRSSDGGATWSAPTIIYNDPDPNDTQYMPWIQVAADHSLHVTYSSSVNNTNNPLAHFYVQSTDRGNTWSTPFQLSGATYNGAGFHGDYQATHIGGVDNCNDQAILASWTDNRAGTKHYARMGTFAACGGTPTPTVTGTPPTSTPTNTVPTATNTACVANYSVAATTGATIVPGTTMAAGSNCDDCSVAIPLPFAFNFYGQSFNSVNAISNGNLQFSSADTTWTNTCLPDALKDNAILVYWDDLLLTTAGDGIYTSTSGSAPNRIFNIEWRACYYSGGSCGSDVSVEARLHEGTGQIDVIYALVASGNSSATGGVQRGTGTTFLQAYCDGSGLAVTAGTMHTYTQGSCGSVTPSATATTGSGSPTVTPVCTPSAGGWSAGANLPTTLTRAQGTYFQPNGKFYAIGGRTGDGDPALAQLNPLEYDPTANTWTQKNATFPNLATSNVQGGVLTLGGQTIILVVGGSEGGGTSGVTDTRVFDPVADTITVLASDPWTPGTTTLPGGVAVVNNKLYVLGGFEINVGMTTAIWEFDPAASAGSRWTLQTATLPTALGYIPTAAIGTDIYTIGGSEWDGSTLVDSAVSFKYDTVADTITTIASTPRATGETRALAYGGDVWVFGGGRVSPNPGNQVEIYDPTTNSYSAGPSFVGARRNFPIDTDGTRIWLAGGYDIDGVTLLNSMEIYTPGGGCTPTATPSATSGSTTPTNTSTSTSTSTSSVTNTSTATTGTGTPSVTETAGTATATATSTACVLQFTDVEEGSTFYDNIRCLACRGIINGYSTGCETGNPCFRPGNLVTRGQLAKIASNSAGFFEPVGSQQYEDVLPGSTFFDFIWRLTERGLVNGYPCGGPGEPCGDPALPYFRPNANVTRGQLAKIVANAAGLTEPVTGQQYEDVEIGSTFYEFIGRLTALGVINGYPCGGLGEPCGDPALPYFRPGANATRGQASKIVANTFFPDCVTPFKAPITTSSR